MDWIAEGISSAKFEYIAFDSGFFFGAHRAEMDGRATLEVLQNPLSESGNRSLAQFFAPHLTARTSIFSRLGRPGRSEPMNVIEQFTCGKHADPAQNEDALFVSEHFVAIIDGATAKSDVLWDDMRSGRFASQVLARSLASLSKNATLDDAVEHLTAALRGEFAARNRLEAVTREPVLRPTAAIVLYSHARQEVWRVGDCPVLVDGVVWPAELAVDQLTAAVRAYVLQAETRKGRTVAELVEHDVGREVIAPLLRYQGLFQNEPERSEWSYCVIDGFQVPVWGRERLGCAAGSEVVLASDGYPELAPTLAATEALLQAALREDPLCMARFRSTKGVYSGQVSFDDRTFVRICT